MGSRAYVFARNDPEAHCSHSDSGSNDRSRITLLIGAAISRIELRLWRADHAIQAHSAGPVGALYRSLLLVLAFSTPFIAHQISEIAAYTVATLVTQSNLWGPALPLKRGPHLLPLPSEHNADLWARCACLNRLYDDFSCSVVKLYNHLAKIFCAISLVAVGYLIPTIPQNKSLFLGATFYGMALMSMVFLYTEFKFEMSKIVSCFSKSGVLPSYFSNPIIWTSLLLVLCAAWGLITRPLALTAIYARDAPQIAIDQDRRATLAAVLQLIGNPKLDSFVPRRPIVYINTVGHFDFDVLQYEALKRGIGVSGTGHAFSDDFEDALAKSTQADIVLLPYQEARGLLKQFVGVQLLDRLADALSVDPRYRRLENEDFGIPVLMRAYIRVDQMVRIEPVQGWDAPEGPYPDRELPFLRRMAGRSALLLVSSPVPVTGRLKLNCLSNQKQTLDVSLDGARVATITVGEFIRST